ncbi:MAG TPA: phospholipase D-like domain-containing protein [Anaeromyxobacter sp.]
MLRDVWTIAVAALSVAVALLASGHAVLHKRDVRAALGWVAFIWFVPVLGAAAYLVLGVNRIRRRAVALRLPDVRARMPEALRPPPPALPADVEYLRSLVALGDGVVRKPLVAGNAVTLLPGGERAYRAMREAIDAAERSVTLSTYIFDPGEAGHAIASALARAHARGARVRVLIDAVGVRYGWPPMHRRLVREGVTTKLFLPRFTPGWLPFVNLRNHRKILVVDGRVGFTGGMNIRDDFLPPPGRGFMDLQARLEGPVVEHLQTAFAEDWLFTAGEPLEGGAFFPPLRSAGPVLARGISDGPDEDFETVRWMLLGALASARERIRIVTPYFLPDAGLVTALDVAVMRGIQLDLVLPERGNLPFIQWAQTAQLWQVLARGCRVWLSPPPFDHTKLMVVDGVWTLLGSANWDPRSLRLNFELDVECYDPDLARSAEALVEERIARGRRIHLADVDGRPLPVKLRDGVARLFSPYL